MVKNSMKNDIMIPLSSQLARRGSIDEINLAGIGDDGSEIPGPDGCTNTAYHVFPKIAHAGNLPIISSSLCIDTENKECSTVLESPKVASRVADFLSKYLGTTSHGEYNAVLFIRPFARLGTYPTLSDRALLQR